jgi:hypothetical protein
MSIDQLDFDDFEWSLLYVVPLLFILGCYWFFRSSQAAASRRAPDHLRR